jgi:hypothetical protein
MARGNGDHGAEPCEVLHRTPNFEVWAFREERVANEPDRVRVTISLDDGSHTVWQEHWRHDHFLATGNDDVVAQVIERCWPTTLD